MQAYSISGDTLNYEQLGLGLFPDLPPGPQPTVTTKKRILRAPKPGVDPKADAPSRPSARPGADFDGMADALEQHADFRVQRRLKPRWQWPATPGQSVTRVLLLDTETTGLDAAKDQIIELALLAVDIDNVTGLPSGELRVYDGLEDPGRPIPKEVVAITGITDADVQGHRLDDARIAEMLANADLVIAHNAGFDRPFVERRVPQFSALPWACSFADMDWRAQGRSSSKLESLALALGLFYDAHRAEMDCHALLAVLSAPLTQGPGTAMGKMLQAAAVPSFLLQATNASFEAKDKLKARGYRWNADQRVWQRLLPDDAALQAERGWLRDQVYGQRAAVVQVEQLDARVKFSARHGVLSQQQL